MVVLVLVISGEGKFSSWSQARGRDLYLLCGILLLVKLSALVFLSIAHEVKAVRSYPL